MQLTALKIVVLALWLAAVGTLGILMDVTASVGWLMIVGFGLLPVTLMLRAWRQPTQTLSESIQAQTRKLGSPAERRRS